MSTQKNYENLETSATVRAVKLTEKNLVSTLNWIGQYTDAEAKIDVNKKGESSNHRLRLRTPKGFRVVRVGEYVVRHKNFGLGGHKLPANAKRYFVTVGKEEFLKEHALV